MISPVVAFLSRRALVTRLLLTQTLVLFVGLFIAWLIDTMVGPPLFHRHLQQGGHTLPDRELEHIEAGFASASLIALVVALTVAMAFALVMSLYLTRRIQGPLDELTHASREVARGGHVQVPTSGIGVEFDQLATAFNQMAQRLDHVEDTRRRLLSDVAHELRTPVTTLDGYLEGLADGIVDWDAETAQVMSEQTSRMIRLIEDIDDVSRAEEGRMGLETAPAAAADVIWTAGAAARDRYTRNEVHLVVDTQSAAGMTVAVDTQRAAQVMANLLGNALRHTPAGGSVHLSARRSGDQVELVVTDNGEGIDPGQLPHVFERFYRGDTARDRDHGGTGIGLTISRAIARAHGGDLTAHSDGVGQGSTFVFILPSLHGRR